MMPPGKIDGWIRIVSPEMTLPSLKDNTADVDRLIKAIGREVGGKEVIVPLGLFKKVPSLLREYAFRVKVIIFEERGAWHVIDLVPPDNGEHRYGIAVDLGTSTVVVRLLDLLRGEMLGEVSFLNPQIEAGPDILTRIHYASTEKGLSELRKAVSERLNEEISGLCRTLGIDNQSVVGMSVAGNTTMTHLFLGLDPCWICREPYIPVINNPGLLKAGELGLAIHRESPVLVFPNVGSYLGGDLIAGILASGMNHEDALSILVDVGTNAEVVLGNREWLMACAGAAGPALEGGVASMGMMAGPGVIDKAVIDASSGEFRVSTIGSGPAIGICGSGLIDLVAQLFLVGMIDIRGKYVAEKCGERLRDVEGIQYLVVVSSEDSGTREDLTLSQPDLDAIIRSKAAMYSILSTITRMINVSMKEIRNFYVAGTFGFTINPQSAITIGMLPDLPLQTYKPLGNTSLSGASMALLSTGARAEIDGIRNRITYVELNVNQEFMGLFSAARFIPHTDRSLFPSIQVWGTR